MMTPRSPSIGSVFGDALGRQAEDVERAYQVDVDDALELREREGALLADRLDGVADAGAVDRDAQRAEDSARSSAATTEASSVTSPAASGTRSPILRDELAVRRRQVEETTWPPGRGRP